MPHYKLIYFDARGLCEAIRIIFHYANETFEDRRITRKEWLAMKDSASLYASRREQIGII